MSENPEEGNIGKFVFDPSYLDKQVAMVSATLPLVRTAATQRN